jgi:hypothetical protein
VGVRCRCWLPAGSSYAHCRACCRTFLTVDNFDSHRSGGLCRAVEGLEDQDGIWGTPEGHERRRILSERFRKKT